MAVEECAAAYPYGVYPYIKHFAFNEQETNRNAILCTWLTEQAARGGTDAMLGTTGNDAIMTDQESATSVLAMRQAVKNILYTVVNSNAYTEEAYAKGSAMPTWQKTLYMADAAVVIVLAALEVLLIRSYMKKKEQAK